MALSLKSFFRPLWHISYPVVSLVSTGAFLHRLVGLVFFNICIVLSHRALNGTKHAALTVVALFLHPTLVYPVTWIAQRNDLILTTFLLLAWLNLHNPRRAGIFSILANLAKSPFVFHSFPVAIYTLRRRRIALSLVLLLTTLAIIAIDYFTQYQAMQSRGVGLGAIHGGGLETLAFTVAARSVKALENLLLVFVPFPALYKTPFLLPIAALYSAILLWIGWEFFHPSRLLSLYRNQRSLLAFLVATWIPLAFAPGLRALMPIIPFCYILVARILSRHKLYRAAMLCLVVCNMIGALNIYGYTNTGAYDLGSEMAFPKEVSSQLWVQDRQEIVDSFIRKVIGGSESAAD